MDHASVNLNCPNGYNLEITDRGVNSEPGEMFLCEQNKGDSCEDLLERNELDETIN